MSSERDAKVVFKYLQEVVADAAGCAELSELDDEAYTHDPALLPGAVSGRERVGADVLRKTSVATGHAHGKKTKRTSRLGGVCSILSLPLVCRVS